MGISPTRAVSGALVVLGLIIVAAAVHVMLGVGGQGVGYFMDHRAVPVVYVLAATVVTLRAIRVREARAAWIFLAGGLVFYAAGNLLWVSWLEKLEAPPIPSISDGLWLALYPASYVGLVLLARRDGRHTPAGVWLDGIVAGLGIAALGGALVFGPTLKAATGSPVAVATNLAYPIADLLLAALVMGVLALRGWRPDRIWGLIGAGFLSLCVADITYLVQVASGSTQSSSLANVFYMSGVGLIALAAWQPRRESSARVEGWSVLFIPAAFVLAAVGLLFYDHFVRLDPFALTLATMTLLAALVRTAITFRDVRLLAVSRREAATDDLTSLPNRRLFLRRTEEAIAGAIPGNKQLALLLIDLDEFKKLNDTLGHGAGDALLCQIGPRVQGALRENDLLARLGGDEFGVLLDAPCDEATALTLGNAICEALEAPFLVHDIHLPVRASIGIALHPAHAPDAQRLLQHADIAMYQAKGSRSGYELYDRHRDHHSLLNLSLAAELPSAIEHGQLEVHFQPKADARSRRIVGMEALVRWRHPTHGLLAPAVLIPLAEQSGMMRRLTREVLGMALARRQSWARRGHELHVTVNATVADLLDTQFPGEVVTALSLHGVDPGALIIEVTESSIMSDPERIGDVLARLGELGVGISLDDFGTGYSSLVHLRTLPVSEVKIDRSFVDNMISNAADHAIVTSTVQLAHNLGMTVVAEGVEDEATWRALEALDCELIQGFFLAAPLAPSKVDAFLDHQQAANYTPEPELE